MTTPPNLDDILRAALAASQGGKGDAAEQLLRRAAEDFPEHYQPSWVLAQILWQQKRADDAYSAAQQSYSLHPAGEICALLAQIEFTRDHLPEADTWTAKAVAQNTNLPAMYELRSTIAERQGFAQEAADHSRLFYKIAPRNRAALLQHCHRLLMAGAAAEGQQALTAYLADAPPGEHGLGLVLLYLATFTEYLERASRGISNTHGATLDDLPMRFVPDILARSEIEALRPGEKTSERAIAAQVAVAQGDIPKAAEAYRSLRTLPGLQPLYYATNLDQDFLADLAAQPDHAIWENLPEMEVVQAPAGQHTRAIFIGADMNYFKVYGPILLGSLASTAAPVCAHLHIYDLDAKERRGLTRWLKAAVEKGALHDFSLSTETANVAALGVDKARAYYHAIRFVRFHQFLTNFGGAAFEFDIDLIFNRSPLPLFDRLEGRDVSCWFTPARPNIHNQLNASVVGVGPTPKGRLFSRIVAGYLAHHHTQDTLTWGIDQIALYAAATHLAKQGLTIVPVMPDQYDGRFIEDTIIWPQKCASTNPAYARHSEIRRQHRQALGPLGL